MKAIRIGLGTAVAFAVLAHGAVEPWSESLLAIWAALLLMAWAGACLYRGKAEIRFPSLLVPLFLLLVIALVQWLGGLSAYPYLTRIEGLKLATYLAFAFLAAQAFRSADDYRPFVWFLLFLGFAVSLQGIIQHFTFNGKIYWFRELRQEGFPFGPFVNRNHFAGLLELIIPLGLAVLLHRGVRRDQLPLVGLFTGISIAALFLSASRGGIVSFLFQLFLLAILVWVRPVGPKAVAAALALLLLTGVFILWLGAEQTFSRFGNRWSEQVASSRRLVIVKDSWRIFLDRPALGTGLGTFQTVYPKYETFYDGKIVNHAHNDYVELLVEAGAAGFACGLLFVFLFFRESSSWLRSEASLFASAVRVGALVSCAGLLLHGVVDFNFHIPSNALLFLLCALMATSPERPPGVTSFPKPA